jgi:hypothetical protein
MGSLKAGRSSSNESHRDKKLPHDMLFFTLLLENTGRSTNTETTDGYGGSINKTKILSNPFPIFRFKKSR